MPSSAQYQQPHVEDCVDEDAPQANVTAKRSKSSSLNEATKNPAPHITSDVATDSGYSSRTATTVSTADSGPRSQPASKSSRAPSVAIPSPATETVTARGTGKRSTSDVKLEKRAERPKVVDKKLEKPKDRTKTVVKQAQPPVARPRGDSRPRKVEAQREEYQHEEDRRSRRPAQQPYPIKTDYHRQLPPESMRSPQRQSYYPPPSPTYSPANPVYTRHDTVLQPAHTRRRGSSSAPDRPRPVSYYSADAVYGQYDRLQTVENRVYGPPPSTSAYMNSAHYAQIPLHYGRPLPHTNHVPQVAQQTPPSPYSATPQPRDTTYSTRAGPRPSSMYNTVPPLISQGLTLTPGVPSPYSQSPGPSARYGPPRPTFQGEEESSDYEEEDYDDIKETRKQFDSMKMLPPTRPAIHYRPDPQPKEYYSRSPVRPSVHVHGSHRRGPSHSSSSRTYTDSTRSSKLYDEDDRYTRRISSTADRDTRRRSVAIEHSDEETFPFEGDQRPSLRRRTRTEHEISRQEREALKHQRDPRGEHIHTSDALLRDKIANPSSRRIERAPSDAKSNLSRRSTMTKATNGGISLYVSGKEDFNISFSGDMKGQTLQVAPVADGGAMIMISGDQVYDTGRSEKSSRSRGPSSAGKSSAKSSQRGMESRTGQNRSRRDERDGNWV